MVAAEEVVAATRSYQQAGGRSLSNPGTDCKMKTQSPTLRRRSRHQKQRHKCLGTCLHQAGQVAVEKAMAVAAA